jgi:putative CocE/NonD family hydrolase
MAQPLSSSAPAGHSPGGRARRRAIGILGGLVLTALGSSALATTAGAEEVPADLVPTSCETAFPAYSPQPVATAGPTTEHEVAMSDGVVLRVNVTLPQGIDGPFPTALTITGYGKDSGAEAFGTGGGLATHGYAVVVADDRGTGASGGGWDSWGERTQADYPELLDWIVAQDWSDGTIGVTGASYMGITSLWTAATQHPAVKAVFATVPMGDAYRDITFAGGEVNAAFIPLWMGLVTGLSLNPTGDPEVFAEHLLNATEFQLPTVADSTLGGAHSYDGPFWRQRSPLEVADRIEVPTFVVGGLDDLFQRGEPMLYEALDAAGTDARLLIGPWNHLTTGQGLPTGGVPDLGQLTLQWFDAHVRGLDTGAECIPPVTQYVRGIEAYRSAPSWPIPGLHAERWHLRGDGTLTAALPEEAEAGKQYLQAPVTGACTRSANQWLIGLVEQTPCATDNRLDEALSLTYTTDPFATDARIDGPIQADLWLAAPLGGEILTSVALSSVAPDGSSRGLTNGLLRASHRAVDESRSRLLDGQSIQPWHPFTEDALQEVPAGEPVLVPVEVFPTSVVIPAGHRLRVTVAAYDVPHALPPLPAAVQSLAAGPVTVLNDAAHPSSVVLPVAGPAIQTAPGDPSDPAAPDGDPADGAEPAGVDGGPADGGREGAHSLPATGAETSLALGAVALLLGLATRASIRR